MKMKVLPINKLEKSIIYNSIYKLFDYLKNDENIELIFIHITQFNGLSPSLNEINACNDFVVNIVCKNKDNFNNTEAFKKIKDIQDYVNNTFAYLSLWQHDEIINNDIFNKFFSRSFIILEKGEENEFLKLWEELQNNLNIPERDVFYIDFNDEIYKHKNELNEKRLKK